MTHRSPVRAAAVVLLALLLGACGAKTGLNVPEVTPEAGVDAGPDALPDAGPDAGPDADARIECLEPDAAVTAPVTLDLTTEAQVATADVLFVVDRTGSMSGEIGNIRDTLRTIIVPGLARSIPDLQLGLVTYSDFPFEPWGNARDVPFTVEQEMTADLFALQGAMNRLTAEGGGDIPEALVEALHQIATGDGLPNPRGGIPAAPGCPTVGTGYACIRPRAQPVLVVITDAPSHNGPSSVSGGLPTEPYTNADFPVSRPHAYTDAVAALRSRLGARVIGINSGVVPPTGHDVLVQLARDTGTVGANGQPLVYDINPDGTGLGQQVVTAVTRFTNETRLNVSAVVDQILGAGGDQIIRGVRAVRAVPPTNVARTDATTFYSVVPGTQLVFGLDVDLSRIVLMDRAQRFVVRVQFLSDGRASLGFRELRIDVPARGMHCPPR